MGLAARVDPIQAIARIRDCDDAGPAAPAHDDEGPLLALLAVVDPFAADVPAAKEDRVRHLLVDPLVGIARRHEFHDPGAGIDFRDRLVPRSRGEEGRPANRL